MKKLHEEILIAGAGGQGVLQLGRIIARAAIQSGLNATFYPTYGAEIRGGTANCSVRISADEISSPVILSPGKMIILNNPSLLKFAGKLRENGTLAVNSSLARVNGAAKGNPLVIEIPATEIALSMGDVRCANTVILGAFAGKTGLFEEEFLVSAIRETFGHKPGAVKINLRALKKGMAHK